MRINCAHNGRNACIGLNGITTSRERGVREFITRQFKRREIRNVRRVLSRHRRRDNRQLITFSKWNLSLPPFRTTLYGEMLPERILPSYKTISNRQAAAHCLFAMQAMTRRYYFVYFIVYKNPAISQHKRATACIMCNIYIHFFLLLLSHCNRNNDYYWLLELHGMWECRAALII